MKKLHMGQNLLIAVLAIATLFFALLLVLSLIPANTDVRIQREIEVSSFEVEASETSDSEWRYLVTAEGSLRNTTDQELIVERIVIPVSWSPAGLWGSYRRRYSKASAWRGWTGPPACW